MSWAEENSIDIGVPEEAYFNGKFINKDTWIRKDGVKLRICDMTNEHLYNAYKKFNDDRLQKEIIGRIFKKVMGV